MHVRCCLIKMDHGIEGFAVLALVESKTVFEVSDDLFVTLSFEKSGACRIQGVDHNNAVFTISDACAVYLPCDFRTPVLTVTQKYIAARSGPVDIRAVKISAAVVVYPLPVRLNLQSMYASSSTFFCSHDAVVCHIYFLLSFASPCLKGLLVAPVRHSHAPPFSFCTQPAAHGHTVLHFFTTGDHFVRQGLTH